MVDTGAETWVEETWVEATWAAVVVSKTMESCNQLFCQTIVFEVVSARRYGQASRVGIMQLY